MMVSRFIAAIALGGTLTGNAHAAPGDGFPARPLRIIVPSTPGGALDILARITSPRLTAKWGQQVVVDNRAGAGGIIGTDIVAKAPADGHTLLVVATGYATNPYLLSKLPYQTPGDFAPITIIGSAPNVLVAHPTLPVKTVNELIALAKSKPKQIAFASSGAGSGGHLSMALLQHLAHITFIHVPYKGAGAATAAVVAGEAQLLFTATGAAVPQIRAGRLRPLAITGAKRVAVLPEVPTVAESGLPGYEVDGWYGVLVPAKTPPAVIDKIYQDLVGVMKMPEVTAQIEAAGFEVGGMPPAQFKRYLASEMKKWETVIRETGLRGE